MAAPSCSGARLASRSIAGLVQHWQRLDLTWTEAWLRSRRRRPAPAPVCVCVCVCVSRHVAVAGGQAPAPALAAGTSVCACVWVSWGGSHVATGKPGSKLCCASVRLPQNEAVNPRRVSVRFPQSRALRFGGGAQRDSKGLTSLATQSSSPASSACTGVCECMCGGGGGGARMRVGA